MVRLRELNVEGARKAATIPAAAEKPVSKLKSHEFTFSKSIVICSFFQALLIIDQGLDTCCNWAARCWQNLCQRISFGSDCDEPQICTYVGSSHGFIVQALYKASCVDPVILLDEVDKIGQSDLHGGPSAVLLEVLDLEQNWNFDYDYINVPTYLSQDLFIYTASFLDTTSLPLLSRCEIVHVAGFSFDEKVVIANRVLVPNQVGMDGLKNIIWR